MPNCIRLTQTFGNSITFYEVHRPMCVVPLLTATDVPIFLFPTLFSGKVCLKILKHNLEKKDINKLGQSLELELLS